MWTCLQTLHRSPVPDRGGPVTVPLPDGKVGPLPSPPLPTWTCLQTLHRSPVPDRGGPVTVPLPDGKVGPLPPLPSPRGPVYRRYTAVLYRTEADPSQYHCQTAR